MIDLNSLSREGLIALLESSIHPHGSQTVFRICSECKEPFATWSVLSEMSCEKCRNKSFWVLLGGKYYETHFLGLFTSKELLEQHPIFQTPGLKPWSEEYEGYGRWESDETEIWVRAKKLNKNQPLDWNDLHSLL